MTATGRDGENPTASIEGDSFSPDEGNPAANVTTTCITCRDMVTMAAVTSYHCEFVLLEQQI